MATYYKWRKSTANYQVEQSNYGESGVTLGPTGSRIYIYNVEQQNEQFIIAGSLLETLSISGTAVYDIEFREKYYTFLTSPASPGTVVQENVYSFYRTHPTTGYLQLGNDRKLYAYNTGVYKLTIVASPVTSQGYVYSTSSSEYPNGGVQDGYYYDQRTTVTSPTMVSNLTYSSSINTALSPSVQLQWTGAQSNTDYPVTEYEISYAINNTDSWQVAGTTGVLIYEFSSIPEEATSIAFRVRAKDSNNQYGDYVTGTYSTITRESPITVTTRTIEMNYFNGTDYEILYPVVGSEVYNHVKSGSYIGSGQYGQSNPNKLELEFTPKVAMITKTSGVYDTYLLNGKTVSYVQSSTGVSEITVEWTGQAVSWYSSDSVEAQLNENGVLYVYTVFG